MTEGQLKRNIFAGYVNEVILGTYFQLPIWIVYQSQFMDFGQIAFFSALALVIAVFRATPVSPASED